MSQTLFRRRLFGAALAWFALGSVLILSTLVPAYSALFGWSPLLWLVLAPLTVLLAIVPALPFALAGALLRRGAPRRAR